MGSGITRHNSRARHGRARQCARGFTLIELIVAVVILSILATLAVPSFQLMIARNRITSHANLLLQAVTLTRSEAIRRNRLATLCPIALNPGSTIDPASPPACVTGGTWGGVAADGKLYGLMVFLDADGDGTLEAADDFVRADFPYGQGSIVTGSGSLAQRVTFSARGISGNNGSWLIKPKNIDDGVNIKTLTLGPTGRPRVS